MHKVLVLTGGLLTEKESSLFHATRKLFYQWNAARGAWLDTKIKAVVAEPFIGGMLERVGYSFSRTPDRRTVRDYFGTSTVSDTPELTEAVLATLLEQNGMPYVCATYSELFSCPRHMQRLLHETDCVFASTTLLHDLSEIDPLIKKLKRSHNHIVLGGALAGQLCHDWEGKSEVDILAVGYGEFLVPALVEWINSNYQKLPIASGGKLIQRKYTQVLHSGLPATKTLDLLETPDWSLLARERGRKLSMVYYESVRGCPYRCSFCNYPYLFDDDRFRYKSARKMVDDWEQYANELNIEYITCLDSLFTMPRRRLIEFCELLIERHVPIKWICYARADDLVDEDTVRLMKRAGVHQVQIGIESGDPTQLENMNKACTTEANRVALKHCRRHGITSVVSLIVGFPGETNESLETTYQFLQESPPDFYYLATFSTRALGVPVLNLENRLRFGLRTAANRYTAAPYWEHATMSCREAVNHARQLNFRLMENRVSLNAVLFYNGMLGFRPEQRNALLTYQHRVATRHPVLRRVFDGINHWIDRKLDNDIEMQMARVPE
jgi:anaerobic magnesium-protoporphyrin IX monomethyl ester cyclase